MVVLWEATRFGDATSAGEWRMKGHEYQEYVRLFLTEYLPHGLQDFHSNFLIALARPKLRKFRLLGTTHKNATVDPNGSFLSRPLVGLFRWVSTPVSIIVGVVGLIILKLDRQDQPDWMPLRDLYDFLRRLRKWGMGT